MCHRHVYEFICLFACTSHRITIIIALLPRAIASILQSIRFDLRFFSFVFACVAVAFVSWKPITFYARVCVCVSDVRVLTTIKLCVAVLKTQTHFFPSRFIENFFLNSFFLLFIEYIYVSCFPEEKQTVPLFLLFFTLYVFFFNFYLPLETKIDVKI